MKLKFIIKDIPFSKETLGSHSNFSLVSEISNTIEERNSSDTVAYVQVKDLSKKDNDRVFLFNGWTFASNPTFQSIDHPIYDLWITGCENI